MPLPLSSNMSPDNLAVIIHVVHSLAGGGTERALVALLRAFNPSRFRHVVVTLREAGRLSENLPGHVACRPIAAVGRSWGTGLALARETRAWRAAVIHARNTCCWHDATLARLLAPRANLVLGFHGLETAHALNRPQRWRAQWALRVGARFTTVSEAGRRQLRRQAHVPADRVDLLRNGVDRRRFGTLDDDLRRRMRAEFGFADTVFVVGTVGSLTPVKDQAILIRAAARIVPAVPDLHLLIVGEGPLRASLTEQAQAYGILERVHFTGWREQVPALLASMDAYACSSASEGMNNALLEAMAAGLPIIATEVGDNAIMVRHGIEGQIVEPGCHEALSEAMKVFANDPAVRRRCAAAAKVRAGSFDFDDSVHAYEDYYQTLIG